LWVITDGGLDADIAKAIYLYRPIGVPMKGSETVDISQVDGSTFTVAFDIAALVNLYLNISLKRITGVIDETALKNYLHINYTPRINQPANTSDIITLINAYDPLIVITVSTISIDNTNWYSDILAPLKKNKFALPVANITITEV
jgi:hypothetical protein